MNMVSRYQQRISGPLMDRIDIHLELARVSFQKLAELSQGESSHHIRGWKNLAKDWRHGSSRWKKLICWSMAIWGQKFCQVDEKGRSLLQTAVKQMNLSERTYHRVLRLSRTIAELAGVELTCFPK